MVGSAAATLTFAGVDGGEGRDDDTLDWDWDWDCGSITVRRSPATYFTFVADAPVGSCSFALRGDPAPFSAHEAVTLNKAAITLTDERINHDSPTSHTVLPSCDTHPFWMSRGLGRSPSSSRPFSLQCLG